MNENKSKEKQNETKSIIHNSDTTHYLSSLSSYTKPLNYC